MEAFSIPRPFILKTAPSTLYDLAALTGLSFLVHVKQKKMNTIQKKKRNPDADMLFILRVCIPDKIGNGHRSTFGDAFLTGEDY